MILASHHKLRSIYQEGKIINGIIVTFKLLLYLTGSFTLPKDIVILAKILLTWIYSSLQESLL